MEFYYHEIDQDVLVLVADGGLDAQTSTVFVEQLETLIDKGLRKIIVDCGKLNYISSAGMSMLLRLHRRMAKLGGDVKLANIHGLIAQILATVHLDRLFDIYPTVDRARLAFRPREDTHSKTSLTSADEGSESE